MKRSLLLSLMMLCFTALFAQTPPHYFNATITQSSVNWPFNANGQKVQMLYTPGQFALPVPAQSGVITSIWFRASTNATNVVLDDLEIKMGQTTATAFNPTTTFVTPLTTVHPMADVNIAAVTSGTWVEIPLPTGFTYNTAQSLIVEVSQDSVFNGFQLYHINTTAARTITGSTGSSSGTSWALTTLGAGITVQFPCTPATNIDITNIGTKSADFNWDYQYPNLKHYEFVINQSPLDPPGTFYQPYVMPPLYRDTFTPNTCYYVHIRTSCTFGAVPDSFSTWALDSFCTLPTCDAPPVTMDVDKITSTTALAIWQPVPFVTKYEYAVSIDTIPPQAGTFTTYTQLLLKGLHPQKRYYFYVRAYCSIPSVSEWTKFPFQTRITTDVDDLASGNVVVEAYPNPAGNTVTILTDGRGNNAKVSIVDMTGKMVQSATITDDRTVLNLEHLTPGLYFIKYTDEMHSEVIKLTKQ